MSRIFITGSADGLGKAAAQSLSNDGHEVIVHVRNNNRLSAVQDLLDRGGAVIIGDLTDVEQTRSIAEKVNDLGHVDAVIHNAGILRGPDLLAVNVVAPYLLTALINRPNRLVYLSSGMHYGGRPELGGLDHHGGSTVTYSDSKLLVTTLAIAVSRLWPDVLSNAVDPGWVPTRMGGPGATDDLHLGHKTQEWLATNDDPDARTSGGYWFHQRRRAPNPAALDEQFQTSLIEALTRLTGTALA